MMNVQKNDEATKPQSLLAFKFPQQKTIEIISSIYLRIPGPSSLGAKWFVKGVNLPSLRV